VNLDSGVTVRADNGPQYIAGHLICQIAHWGMGLSHAFPHQPETNGVCERFFRTLKEQADLRPESSHRRRSQSGSERVSSHAITSAGASLGSASAAQPTTGRETPSNLLMAAWRS